MRAVLCGSIVGIMLWSAASTRAAAQAADAWSIRLLAESGIGMRDVDLPRDGVIYKIRSGVYPVLGVGFQLDYHSSERFSVGLAARYQSSIGLVLDEQLAGGVAHARATRSHHVEVGIAPRLHWDESGWAISTWLGYGVLELDPLNHLVTPSYHLGGAHARVSVRVPIGSARVGLWLGPEAQWTLHTGEELQARGVATRGPGVGAQAALELRFAERWVIAAAYRELRYWLSTQQGPSFSDAVRVISAQLGGVL